MKIELEIPYIKDDDISIKITIKKDGEVSIDREESVDTPPQSKKNPTSKKKSVSLKNNFSGNMMNLDDF